MARISVFGIGYVGVVAAACLARDGHQVVAVDVDPGKIRSINDGISPIVENGLGELIAAAVAQGRLSATADVAAAIAATDTSFVCVGTPSAADGSVGLRYVEQACRDIGAALAAKDAYHSVVIRSTIVPGSTEGTCIPALEQASGKRAGVGFGVGYYPEFLRESTAIEDYDAPGLIVFGAMDEPTAQMLTALNEGLGVSVHVTDLRTAEMVKYTSNTWRALKVTFANEIGNIAKANGLDGQTVMEILCSDTKVAMSRHFMRPGFAFGGSCLPKDVRALRHLARATGVEPHLLDAVVEANEAQIQRARAMVRASGATEVGFVGIAFKPGTDDLRESPLAELAARLIEDGIEVGVYDPDVQEAFASNTAGVGAGRGNDVIPDLEGRMVASLDDLIERTGAILVGNFYKDTVVALEAAAARRPVVDLARVSRARVSDGRYQGICW